ncbi:hypothetical protein VFPPC_17702 [Pochonia chlamydosporia 170]|uniref:Uncharacterized protein n=1 Tax=Pochonia chlamydosporia 170 TaxID=1380566 RepID=A0A219AR98_METCM|nr:hypothetical protein VFPPC_17702 [Pochonia chlamydosporia 170]OWT43122.1 hypothetical protein VFPPC_17702 [Pochonia chlamydosporia 170]
MAVRSFSLFANSSTLSTSGRVSVKLFGRNGAVRLVILRAFFSTDIGPNKNPGRAGRRICGKHAKRPRCDQFIMSPSSPISSSSSSSSFPLRRETALRCRCVFDSSAALSSAIPPPCRIYVMALETNSSTSIPRDRLPWVRRRVLR